MHRSINKQKPVNSQQKCCDMTVNQTKTHKQWGRNEMIILVNQKINDESINTIYKLIN